jgi:hypothetical protein
VDAAGNTFVLTDDGTLHGFDPNGIEIMTTVLSSSTTVGAAPLARWSPASITIGPTAIIMSVAAEHIFGVQNGAGIANSPWPRHRRDNLSTGHR